MAYFPLVIITSSHDQVYVEQFSYNVTDAKDCVPAKDNHSEPNCTKFTNGSFTGLGSGATYSDVVADLFTGNLWPRYVSSYVKNGRSDFSSAVR